MTKTLKEQVNELKWFHSIEYEPDKFTPGVKTPEILSKEREILLNGLKPLGFRGKSVVDVGAWDGYFSFLAADEGAKYVLATDHFCWGGPGWGTKEGFDLLNSMRKNPVDSLEADIPELSDVGYFHIVLCLGVFYHLRDPYRLVERLFDLAETRGTVVLETRVDGLKIEEPVMVYYPGDTVDGDSTNFWGPNPKCVIKMCKDIGFYDVDFVHNKHDQTRGWFFCRK